MKAAEKDFLYHWRKFWSAWLTVLIANFVLIIGKLGSSIGQTIFGSIEAYIELLRLFPKSQSSPHTTTKALPTPTPTAMGKSNALPEIPDGGMVIIIAAALSEFLVNLHGRVPSIRRQVDSLSNIHLEFDDTELVDDVNNFEALKVRAGQVMSIFKPSFFEGDSDRPYSKFAIWAFVRLSVLVGLWASCHVFLAAYLGGDVLFEQLLIGTIYNSFVDDSNQIKEIVPGSALYHAKLGFSWYIGLANWLSFFAFQFPILSHHALAAALFARNKCDEFSVYLQNNSGLTITKDMLMYTVGSPFFIAKWSLQATAGLLTMLYYIATLRPGKAKQLVKDMMADSTLIIRFAIFMCLTFMISSAARGFFSIKHSLLKFSWTQSSSEAACVNYARWSILANVVSVGLTKVPKMYDLITSNTNTNDVEIGDENDNENSKQQSKWLPEMPSKPYQKWLFLTYVVVIGFANIFTDGLSSFKSFNSLWKNVGGSDPMSDYVGTYHMYWYVALNLLCSVTPGAFSQWSFATLIAFKYWASRIKGDRAKLPDDLADVYKRILNLINDDDKAELAQGVRLLPANPDDGEAELRPVELNLQGDLEAQRPGPSQGIGAFQHSYFNGSRRGNNTNYSDGSGDDYDAQGELYLHAINSSARN